MQSTEWGLLSYEEYKDETGNLFYSCWFGEQSDVISQNYNQLMAASCNTINEYFNTNFIECVVSKLDDPEPGNLKLMAIQSTDSYRPVTCEEIFPTPDWL